MGTLTGKVAIVTGGASGIGRALAEELARRGGEVVIADRQDDLAREVAEGIRVRGGRAEAAALDVRDAAAFVALARATRARSGAIDYLFNNAGIGVAGEVAHYTQADWDDVLDVNLRGVVHGVQAVYPAMVARRSGHIVNTASAAGILPIAGECSYTTSKYAVVGLSRSLRVEAKRHGVRVSVLCPGVIRTPILTGGRYGRINLGPLTDAQLNAIWARMRPMPADAFARRALDAVLRDASVIVFPTWWRAFWLLDRVSPVLGEALSGAFFARMVAELEALGVKPPAPGDPEA